MISHRLSCASVLIDAYSNAPPSIATATGFLVDVDDVLLLLTNHHVLSGRDADTAKPLDKLARLPDRVLIPLPEMSATGGVGWRTRVWMLADANEKPLWCEHLVRGREVDVAVLPLGTKSGLRVIPDVPYSPQMGSIEGVSMASEVSIIGFPEELPTAGLTGIWKTGHVGSEPLVDLDGKPCFWVDAAGARGMSGSPVIISRGSSQAEQLLGVYSGRARADTTLGRVWRWPVVKDVIQEAVVRVKKGTLVPHVGRLGAFERPDDVRVPNTLILDRPLVDVAAMIANVKGRPTREAIRAYAVLAAAAARAKETGGPLVLPRDVLAPLDRSANPSPTPSPYVVRFFYALDAAAGRA